MTVRLSPHVEEWIERLVESGRFDDADHVVESALSRLDGEDPEYWKRVEELAAESDEDIREGRLTRVDPAFIESLRERVRRHSRPESFG